MLSFFCFSLKLKVCSLGQIFLHQKQIGMKTNLLDDRLMVGAFYLSSGLSLRHSSLWSNHYSEEIPKIENPLYNL